MSVTSLSDTGHVGDLVAIESALDLGLQSVDPLHFPGYTPPGVEQESVRTWTIRVAGVDAVWIDCDLARSGGTLGVVAGEQIVRAYDSATALRRPVVATMSGAGARLEEGMLALLQMARTASAVARHRAAGLVTVAHLGSPTVGGAYLSWISLADVRAAEPGATTGSIGTSAEDAYGVGMIDAIVPREERWPWVAGALGKGRVLPLALPEGRRPRAPDRSAVPEQPYAQLLRCRAGHRPSGLEWATWLSEGWTELRGAQEVVRAGLAWIEGRRVMVIATDRHASPDGLGVPAVEGLRLAQRAIRLAGRWGIPLLTLVDAPSVEPSRESPDEIGAQTAQTLLAMSELRSPSVSIVVGEVGSTSGAGALTHTDRLLMLEGTLFWVLGRDTAGPEHEASELISAYRMGARDLTELGVADDVVVEDVAQVRAAVAKALADTVRGGRDHRPDRATERALIWHRFEACRRGQWSS